MISIQLLSRYPIFAGLSQYMLEEIAMISEEIEVEEGEWLFYEGEDAEKVYIVLEGSVCLTINIFIDGKARDIEAIEPVGAGELLGWSGLIAPHLYTLGGISAQKSHLIQIQAEALRELLDDNPEYGYPIIKNIAEVIGDRLTQKCIQFLSLVLDSKDIPKDKLYLNKKHSRNA